MGIVEQLLEIYRTENYYDRGLTELEANRYYSKMMGHGRIHVYMDGERLIGFLESWRLSYEQLGRVVCWSSFSALTEDVSHGPVVYVSDIWVDKDKRGNGISKILIDMFKESNKDAEYFVSTRNKNKGYSYIRVYDKETGYKHKEK